MPGVPGVMIHLIHLLGPSCEPAVEVVANVRMVPREQDMDSEMEDLGPMGGNTMITSPYVR